MIQDMVPRAPKRPDQEKETQPIETNGPVFQAQVITPTNQAFKTPDEVAIEDTPAQPVVATGQAASIPPTKRRWYPHTRKQWIITGAIVVLLAAGGATGWVLTRKSTPEKPKKTATKAAIHVPAPIYSTLSGLSITDASLNKKPVTAVMVENSTFARPQSGLSQAGVVFEAQAEGGVTRFMALYQDTNPTNVGPIRSARPYYVQWALGFDAAYAHVGGSPDALSDITSWGVQDMNQFYNGNSFHRITTRDAPHNVYTGIDTLNQLESTKGYSSSFTGFPRDADAKPLAQPTASSIDLAISGPTYNPHFDYDATTNSYNRSTDGTADTDANTSQQISPKVVIAIVVPLSQGALDASGAYYSDYNVLGSGTAYVFQNGGVTTGEWHKTDNASQITFTTASGTTIPLNRGQTWITALSNTNQVTYKGATPSTTPK